MEQGGHTLALGRLLPCVTRIAGRRQTHSMVRMSRGKQGLGGESGETAKEPWVSGGHEMRKEACALVRRSYTNPLNLGNPTYSLDPHLPHL